MKLDPEIDEAARLRFEVLANAFERAYATTVYPAFEAVAAIPDRVPADEIRCAWCGRTRNEHQAMCYEDGSESTEGRLKAVFDASWQRNEAGYRRLASK